MSNVILKNGETSFEIISRPSVLQMDKIVVLYKKYNAMMIGEFELTLGVAKVLLVDKTKEIDIDNILIGEYGDNITETVNKWGEAIFDIIKKAEEAKKKHKK